MIAVYCDGSYHADTGKAGIAVILYHNQAPVYLLTDEVVAANPTEQKWQLWKEENCCGTAISGRKL